MPSRSAITVSLTPELQRFIAGRIGSGRYRSASEVVREALRCLERAHADNVAPVVADDDPGHAIFSACKPTKAAEGVS
jgi:putative addiction module CopG family antidote